MSERAGTIQGPPDISTGKRISNAVVMLPAGTVLTNADGTTTTLAADTPAYLQRVVIGDVETLASASVSGEAGRGALGVELASGETRLESIDATLREILNLLKINL